MTAIVIVLIFILGTTIGSFLSVVLFRLKEKKQSIFFSRSMCPACKKQLKARHLVPIFSWLFLRGRCGYCGAKISIHYLILELVTGLIFLVTFLKFNFLMVIPSTINPEMFNYFLDWKTLEIFVFYIIEFSLLIGIFFYDLLYKEIPDQLSLPAIGIAIAGGLIFGSPQPLSMALGGVMIFLFFALQFVLSRGTWIGGGDLRLGAFMGVFLGWEKGLLALVIAYIVGAIVSLILMLGKKVNRKSQIAFGPFLVMAVVVCVFYGDVILNWYLT